MNIVYSVTHQLKAFGYLQYENPTRDEVTVRVKSLLSLIRLVHKPKKDFSEKRFMKAFKHSKIPEADRSDYSSTSSSDDDGKVNTKKKQ
jgi:IQ calmodulin-binding motif